MRCRSRLMNGRGMWQNNSMERSCPQISPESRQSIIEVLVNLVYNISINKNITKGYRVYKI